MTPEDLNAFVYDEVTTQRVTARSEGEWLRMPCPVCEERGKVGGDVFGINVRTGYYHCFRCAVRGTCRALADDTMTLVAVEQTQKDKPGLPEGFLPLEGNEERPEAQAVIAYLVHERGFSVTALKEAMVGFVGATRYYSGRAIIPVWSWDNWCCGFSARFVSGCDNPVKYLYPKGMDRDDIYLAEELKRETDEPILVVEGVLDALAYWPNAVACLGKPTGSQLQNIAANTRRPVVVAMDRDAPREAKAARAVLRRNTRHPVGLVTFSEGSHVSDIGALAANPDITRAAAWKAVRNGEASIFL
jgi:hypothetical protein